MTEDYKVTFMNKEFKCVDVNPNTNKTPDVDVVIRPEDITIHENPEEGQWRGVVRSCIFQGVHYELFLDTPDGYEIQVQDYNQYEIGREYGLSVKPDGIHVMAVEHTMNEVESTIVDSDHINMLGEHFMCQKHGFLADETVTAKFGFDIEITDDPADGMVKGTITFILYKGDHYQLTITTENGQKIFINTTDVWEDYDEVGIKILPEQIELSK